MLGARFPIIIKSLSFRTGNKNPNLFHWIDNRFVIRFFVIIKPGGWEGFHPWCFKKFTLKILLNITACKDSPSISLQNFQIVEITKVIELSCKFHNNAFEPLNSIWETVTCWLLTCSYWIYFHWIIKIVFSFRASFPKTKTEERKLCNIFVKINVIESLAFLGNPCEHISFIHC